MIDYLKDKLIDDDLLNAPKVLRTHCYAQTASLYDIECLLCGSHNIEWSEFESHIWCYDCKKDVFIIHRYAGIFGGPIPIEVTHMLGVHFDRINLKTHEITKELDHKLMYKDKTEYDRLHDIYNNTWVHNKSLKEYEKMIEEKLK